MAMKPVLDSERTAYRKLEREAYRAIHAKSANHKADHFFNFCVTAHAMRDFFLEGQGILPGSASANAFHAAWSQEPLLVAAADIANLSKHFQLRDRKTNALRPSKTRRLVRKRGEAMDVFVNSVGDIKVVPRPTPEMTLTLSDGSTYDLWTYDLWEFVIDVTQSWREFLRSHGIRVRRQSVPELMDTAPPRGA